MTCDHERMEFDIEPRAFNDTNVRTLRMSVRCERCKQVFRFIGMTTRTDLDAPSVSTDDTVVTLPVIEQFEETQTARMHS